MSSQRQDQYFDDLASEKTISGRIVTETYHDHTLRLSSSMNSATFLSSSLVVSLPGSSLRASVKSGKNTLGGVKKLQLRENLTPLCLNKSVQPYSGLTSSEVRFHVFGTQTQHSTTISLGILVPVRDKGIATQYCVKINEF